MDEQTEKKTRAQEVEAYGITYDRFALTRLQRVLTRELNIRTVLESPCHGAKAAGALYSIGFAKAGSEVTLVNPDRHNLRYWQALNLDDRLHTVFNADPESLDFPENRFDLAWNFVTFAELGSPDAWLAEMCRVSAKYVMVVACNNAQLGYPWHRVLHKVFGIPWRHGDPKFNYPWTIKRWFARHGLRIAQYGTLDSPPWPDPVGFRDIRLHRQFGPVLPTADVEWRVPMMDYLMQNRFPLWMRLLGRVDTALRYRYLKLPVSHLFYVIGTTDK